MNIFGLGKCAEYWMQFYILIKNGQIHKKANKYEKKNEI